MMSEYDQAMAIVAAIIQSQMAWPSERMLRNDLMRAFALLGEICPKCQCKMVWTATAPILNAPMVWRCFECVDLGTVATNAQAGPPPHAWTSSTDTNKCDVCGDGPWGRHRFQETVIEINEKGEVSPQVHGPIRDGGQ